MQFIRYDFNRFGFFVLGQSTVMDSGQHLANCPRHAVQQQQRNGHRKTCSFWPLPASDDQHYVARPSSNQWRVILGDVHLGTNHVIISFQHYALWSPSVSGLGCAADCNGSFSVSDSRPKPIKTHKGDSGFINDTCKKYCNTNNLHSVSSVHF